MDHIQASLEKVESVGIANGESLTRIVAAVEKDKAVAAPWLKFLMAVGVAIAAGVGGLLIGGIQ